MFRRWRALARLDADIRDHLEREIQDNVDRGMTPEEAPPRLDRLWQRVAGDGGHARGLALAARRRALPGRPLRTAHIPSSARVRGGRRADARARHRREHGDLQPVRGHHAEGVALHEPEQLYFVAHGARRFAPSSNYPPTSACAPGPTCLPASLATRGHVQSGRGRWRRNDARTVRQRQLSRGSRCADGDRARVHRRERP